MIQRNLDPRAPWVISTHDLGRRPGSMRRMNLVLPAPADIGVDMIGVPRDADVELDIRLEAVMEGVLVTGTAQAPLRGECARCLEPVISRTEVDFQELFFYSAEDAAESDSLLDGELLDLEPAFRDAVVLTLPLSPVCGEDCTGLCAECGVRLADAEPDHGHEVIDARWAKLQGLVPEHNNDQES
ncbi:YceD family protein [Streptosporangium sp. NBC_01755]|uniref:YceD family protein n=1 Tax=unclassified Streptosporangium TaxID=2632669 RepID=UPI002DD87480|nr:MULTISPECIES: YceD family protein [unclassified Streptosporangium]WSA26573.1 YceD family protein [Streptosporangium sp. NBC_01810]WSD02003.1 YceD family protein [Streptosporangium sp. NBC_01755]